MFQSFMDSLSDPASRHAMIVHIPIALGALGLVPVMGLAATRFASRPLKLLCVGWFVVASAGAALAANAGEAAEDRAEKTANAAAKAALHDHEELGENGWIWPLIPAGLVALTLVPRPKLAATAGVLAMVGAAGVMGWVAYTGHTGGRLVYVYGVGVPGAQGAAQATPTVKERVGDDD